MNNFVVLLKTICSCKTYFISSDYWVINSWIFLKGSKTLLFWLN